MAEIVVSVIVPVRNEERYIEACIKSLIKQDYPIDSMEIIFIDGVSEDNTAQIIRDYIQKHPYISLYSNPHRTVPYSMNIGISKSRGVYIVRIDAHAEYSQNYISKCVEYLQKTGADNVGGAMRAVGKGLIGKGVEFIHGSKFGIGVGKFHDNSFEGYVDTVYLGAFKKETLLNVGMYNTKLTRNQDIELNSRIIKSGGKIYLTPEVVSTYFCRDSFSAFAKQNFQNGEWNIYTLAINNNAMSIRHFVPLAFVASIVGLGILSLFGIVLFQWLFMADILLYTVFNILFSLEIAFRHGIKYLFSTFLLFPILHVCYGMGSLVGVLKLQKFLAK